MSTLVKYIFVFAILMVCLQMIEMSRLPRDDTAVAESSDDKKLDLSELANKLMDEIKKAFNNEDLNNLLKSASENLQEVGKKVSDTVTATLNSMKSEQEKQQS